MKTKTLVLATLAIMLSALAGYAVGAFTSSSQAFPTIVIPPSQTSTTIAIAPNCATLSTNYTNPNPLGGYLLFKCGYEHAFNSSGQVPVTPHFTLPSVPSGDALVLYVSYNNACAGNIVGISPGLPLTLYNSPYDYCFGYTTNGAGLTVPSFSIYWTA